MGVDPRVASVQNDNRELQRRVAALERAVTRGGVDYQARSATETVAETVISKTRTYRQNEPPDIETLVVGDLWFDTNDGNAPYVWQKVSGLVTTSGASAKQGLVTTAGATGKLQTVTLAPNTDYYLTVKARWKSGARVYFDVRDEVNGITVTAVRSLSDDAWGSMEAQITTGPATPTLMVAVRADDADPAASVFLADALTLATSYEGTNLLPNGGFEEGLTNWVTTGALVNTGATLEFSRDDAWSGAWVSAQDAAVLASGNRIFRQTTAPDPAVVGPLKEGDLWYDTDDKNRPYVWQGGAWVNVRDATISDAQAAATLAQNMANGKNKIFVSGTTPTATAEGDQWIDTANANTIKTWTGGTWVTQRFGAGAISSVGAGSITGQVVAGQIASVAATVITGQVIASQIASGAIIADKIDANAVTAVKIEANAVTAAKIEANAMTAKNFYTAAAGSNRIVMGPAANIYNNSEPRIIFDYDGNLSASDASIRSATTGLIIHGGTSSGTNSSTWIEMSASVGQPDRITLNAQYQGKIPWTTATLDGSFGTYGRFQVNCDLTVDKTLGVTGRINSYGTNQAPAAGATGNPLVRITGSTGNYEFRPDAVSSRRYKEDITGIADAGPELDPRRLLDLPVRAFRYKAGYLGEGDAQAGMLLPGFIAEEVHDAYPAAAGVTDGGEVENWSERCIIPGMLALLQDAHRRLEALEEAT